MSMESAINNSAQLRESFYLTCIISWKLPALDLICRKSLVSPYSINAVSRRVWYHSLIRPLFKIKPRQQPSRQNPNTPSLALARSTTIQHQTHSSLPSTYPTTPSSAVL